MSDAAKQLIVNADDFGLSDGVNRGIIEAHQRGIVTSASLMVRWPAAGAAAAYAKGHPELSVGLHIDLGEWVRGPGEYDWSELYYVIDTADVDAVRVEIRAQIDRFVELIGAPPTHLDSHQHVHRKEPARSVVLEAGRELGVVVRHFDSRVRYVGGFYGQDGRGQPWPQGISVAHLLSMIAELPEAGITEFGCHPGDDLTLATPYRGERREEVAALTSPDVRRALAEHRVQLRSFRDLGGTMGA